MSRVCHVFIFCPSTPSCVHPSRTQGTPNPLKRENLLINDHGLTHQTVHLDSQSAKLSTGSETEMQKQTKTKNL